MKLSVVFCVATVTLLPLAHAVFLVASSSSAASSTVGLTLGTSGSAAAALGVAGLVAGALVLGGLALAASRNKRDVSSHCLPSSSPELILELAASADQLGCGLRLVCELEATPDDALSTDELLILNLFGRQVKPVTFSQMKNAKSSFQYAALVGSRAKSVTECGQVFDQCPFDRRTIMGAFNATK
ncbi:uncharacterized protein LOC135107224 [Scylla paramamosain]|uniref:uncharacterized protein LOC135107224 n=1 Tax=Scylla paramamosain TaxID=85552 RepID=UPI0030830ACD